MVKSIVCGLTGLKFPFFPSMSVGFSSGTPVSPTIQNHAYLDRLKTPEMPRGERVRGVSRVAGCPGRILCISDTFELQSGKVDG